MTDQTTASEQSSIGPGEGPIHSKGVIAIAAYLIVVTLLILAGLYWRWPECESSASTTSPTANAGQPTNSNSSGDTTTTRLPSNANSSGAANVSTNANANITTTTSQNRNGNGNQNTGTSTNSNSTQNANGDSTQESAGVKVISVSPASGSVKGDTWITIKGTAFKLDNDADASKTKVTFGGLPGETISGAATGEWVTVRTPAHPAGKVDVAVINAEGKSDVLSAAYTFTCPPPSDADLILVVILAGALGGSIHAIRSFWWYVGNRELVWSWALMYILLPFTGAAIATVFFLIIRGGFMDPPKDKEATLFVIAIAVLTGLFSQQAALKLADIANAVFTKPGEGKNPVPQASESIGASGATRPPSPSVPKIDPPKGPLDGNQDVIITGTGFTSVKSVSFGGLPASAVSIDPATSAISAKTPQQTTKGEVEVTVQDDKDQTVKLKYTYE